MFQTAGIGAHVRFCTAARRLRDIRPDRGGGRVRIQRAQSPAATQVRGLPQLWTSQYFPPFQTDAMVHHRIHFIRHVYSSRHCDARLPWHHRYGRPVPAGIQNQIRARHRRQFRRQRDAATPFVLSGAAQRAAGRRTDREKHEFRYGIRLRDHCSADIACRPDRGIARWR